MPYKDKAKQKEWVANNKERIAEWRLANRERLNQLSKKWRKNNPEKVKAMEKAKYLANIEKHKAYSLEWKKNNRDKVRLSQRVFRLNHLEEEKQRLKKYRDELSDVYIRDKLKIKISDVVPKALIEVKRLQILINRRIKDEKCNATT